MSFKSSDRCGIMLSPATSQRLSPRVWTTQGSLLLVIPAAIVLGFIVSQAKWLYLGAVAFGLAILFYPVQSGLGLFGALLPFDNISVLGSSGSSTLPFLVGAASGVVLVGIGLVGGRLQRPPGAAFWCTSLVL